MEPRPPSRIRISNAPVDGKVSDSNFFFFLIYFLEDFYPCVITAKAWENLTLSLSLSLSIFIYYFVFLRI
jgi:hypothetical protein